MTCWDMPQECAEPSNSFGGGDYGVPYWPVNPDGELSWDGSSDPYGEAYDESMNWYGSNSMGYTYWVDSHYLIGDGDGGVPDCTILGVNGDNATGLGNGFGSAWGMISTVIHGPVFHIGLNNQCGTVL